MTSTAVLDVNHTLPVGASDSLSNDKLLRKRNITDSFEDCNDGYSVHQLSFLYDTSYVPRQDTGRFHVANNLEASLTTGTREVANIGNPVSFHFHQQDPSASMCNSAVVEIPRSIYSQHFTYNVTIAAEVKKSHASGSDHYMENNQANLSSLDGMNLQQVSRATPSTAVITSRSLMLSEYSQNGMFGNEMISNVEGHNQNTQRQLSCNDSISTAYAYNGSSSVITCASEIQNLHGSSERQRNFFDSRPVNMVTNELHNDYTGYQSMAVMEENQSNFGRIGFHVSTDLDTNSSNPYSSNSCNTHSLVEENGSNKRGNSVTKESYEHQSLSSLNVESPRTVKLTSFAGKLWDGTLQLNTSTTVSALAFFRSGEKSTDINWPDQVEVKGKVRLEAFEKFVQELPRSRTRGLMVISLCWRIGSSESGLSGLKEVARGYIEGQRVGYAPLCSGIDLYLCPRCEAIITILAKYGFFKGMTAVEEDQDSLIGCVVWRRNLTPLSSTSKKSKAKNSPPEKSEKSPSDFAIQNAKSKLEETKAALCGENNQNILKTEQCYVTVENHKVEISESVAPSNQFNPSVISVQLPHYSKGSSSHTLAEQRLDHKISNSMIPNTGCTPPVPPSSTHGMLKNTSAVDDDLPEFDFGYTCGVRQLVENRYQQSSHQEDLSINSHKIQVEEGKTRLPVPAQPPLPPGPPPVNASRQTDPMTFQTTSYFIQSFPTSAGIAGEHFSKCSSAEQTHESSGNPVSLGNALPTIVSNSELKRKNIWDDDDDMPEWCPPDMDHRDIRQAPPPPPPPPPLLPSQQMPSTQPPLPPYPRPPVCVVSRPRSPPIPQETPEISTTWSSRGPNSQFLAYPSNNQGRTLAEEAGLLGPGPHNSSVRLSKTTRNVSRNFQTGVRPPGKHHDETSGPQSSRFEAKPYRRPSPVRSPERTTRHWHSGFDQEHENSPYFGSSKNGTLRHRSTGFSPKPGQGCSPRSKHDETSKRRRTGFDVLPDHRYSPGLSSKQFPDRQLHHASSPKQSSRRRRASLFDVKSQLSSKDWRR